MRNKKLNTCIEEIVQLFFYDSFILLDCVLEDDLIDPAYSADMVFYRLERCLLFWQLYYKDTISDFSEFLLKNGYSESDIELLKFKRDEEHKRMNTGNG